MGLMPIFTDEAVVELVRLCVCAHPCGDFPECLGYLDADEVSVVTDDRLEEPEQEPERMGA